MESEFTDWTRDRKHALQNLIGVVIGLVLAVTGSVLFLDSLAYKGPADLVRADARVTAIRTVDSFEARRSGRAQSANIDYSYVGSDGATQIGFVSVSAHVVDEYAVGGPIVIYFRASQPDRVVARDPRLLPGQGNRESRWLGLVVGGLILVGIFGTRAYNLWHGAANAEAPARSRQVVTEIVQSANQPTMSIAFGSDVRVASVVAYASDTIELTRTSTS